MFKPCWNLAFFQHLSHDARRTCGFGTVAMKIPTTGVGAKERTMPARSIGKNDGTERAADTPWR
jgi:hypothetical protein